MTHNAISHCSNTSINNTKYHMVRLYNISVYVAGRDKTSFEYSIECVNSFSEYTSLLSLLKRYVFATERAQKDMHLYSVHIYEKHSRFLRSTFAPLC